MTHTLTCPACNRPVPDPAATRCPACGAAIANPAAKKPKKKKKKPAAASKFPLKWVAIGAACLLVPLVLGCGVLTLIFGLGRHGGGGSSGKYAVVDDLPDAPPPAADDPPALPEPLAPKRQPRLVWAAKPDPAANPVDYSTVFGAATPDQNVLRAGLNGPFVAGIKYWANQGKRVQLIKTRDPNGAPYKTVPADDAPYPVFDVRTGKEAGAFPPAAKLESRSRLGPDGQYAATWETEPDPDAKAKPEHDFLLLWQRGGDKPVLRWPVPARVYWMEFVGPDRLAMFHTGPTPRFVVLDVTKGETAVAAALPAADFPPTNDLRGPGSGRPYYQDLIFPCGAVSPGGAYAALAGKSAIVVVATADGRAVGRLPLGANTTERDFWGMSFDEIGSELRAAYQTSIRTWSMADGQPLQVATLRGERPRGNNTIASGPEPGTLVFGNTVLDLPSGKPITDLPFTPLRWLGPDRVLAVAYSNQAVNRKAIEDAAESGIGLGVLVAGFKRDEYQKKAEPFVAGRENAPLRRPPTGSADRTGVAAIKPQPDAAWAVKPSAAPPLPAGATLQEWPLYFAATEAAAVPDGRTWVRYDLKTAREIDSVRLWPNSVADVGKGQDRLVALALDGQRLAVMEPSDKSRVDTWDAAGKHLTGLRPYADEAIHWLAWSAGGRLLTACEDLITGWDVTTGKAVFEIDGAYKWWKLAPGAGWFVATTAGGNLDFYDAATGKPLGRLPGYGPNNMFSISPDGKTLVWTSAPGAAGGIGVQVWDLETGKRSTTPEVPFGPIFSATYGHWAGPRRILTFVTGEGHTAGPAGPGGPSGPSGAGQATHRFLLYDFDLHTHTYSFDAPAGLETRADPLGRAWMRQGKPSGRDKGAWVPLQVPAAAGFRGEFAFGPGSTVRVEVDVGHREYSQRMASQTATQFQKIGMKIGRGGWVLRADHTIGKSTVRLDDPTTGRQRPNPYIALNITWKLIAPDGTEVWQTTGGGSFSPFTSKYVVPGSRTRPLGPQGGVETVQLDFGGKNAQLAQIEEILEQSGLYGPAFPPYVAKTSDGYAVLPLKATFDSAK